MNRVLVVGNGAREHALAWKLSQSPSVDEIHAAPGNPGIAQLAECHAVDVADAAAIAKLADDVDAELTIIGPEVPLVAGAVDAIRARGRLAFGPTAAGAQLEGSKAWMKDVLRAGEVPTASHATFGADDLDAALAHLETLHDGWVIKTDGLAAGKGVAVCDDIADARDAVRSYLSGEAFGASGTTLVIEELLRGPELSLMVICDGTRAWPMIAAQDHKRVGDGDTGPNTGGMGAYAPVPFVDAALIERVMERCVRPTLHELALRGAEYRGVLFTQFMVTADGPKIIEYNVRFGDPETEVLVPLLSSDLYAHCAEAALGELSTPIEFADGACAGVVLAAPGYPTDQRVGDAIEGLADTETLEQVQVFHAGTRQDGDTLRTAGGRVVVVSATGTDLDAAVARAYDAAARITWPGVHYRHDIAAQGLHQS